ncbi:MAG: geranylgeranyl diphosphate synthase, type [Candidatus Binatota bacterium]|nr:geranylgeranyl diphosphate synthase, type [Candidatus Binatota bacterium]
MEIDGYLRDRAAHVEAELARRLADPERGIEPKLLEAMCYSTLDAGKRIRPILLLASGEACGGSLTELLPFACAVEMVHCYSLIHDDLPSMDDDDFRRGRPSNHKVFGEAVAILAGDGLLTEAFALLAAPGGGIEPERRIAAVRELATAAGAGGMVGGQVADLLAEGTGAPLAVVESIHRRKTGALLRAAVRMGGLLAGGTEAELERLDAYGGLIGLAFQVADDLLDETGNVAATGKHAARDRARGKSTYPSALGVDGARDRLRGLLAQAIAEIEGFGPRGEALRGIAGRVASRAL